MYGGFKGGEDLKITYLVFIVLFFISMSFLMSGCEVLEAYRNPVNKERAEKIIALEEKIEIAVRDKTLDIKEGISMLREVDDLKKDVSGSGNALYAILGTLGNAGLLLLRHKLPGIKNT